VRQVDQRGRVFFVKDRSWAMARTKPPLENGRRELVPILFSRASRNRKLMRVATTTALGETRAAPRSRFRTPQNSRGMDPLSGEPARPKASAARSGERGG